MLENSPWPPSNQNHTVTLEERASVPHRIHEFDEQTILAINCALAARRPLLIRGEPGVGKSQLAEAAASVMQRVFISKVVDHRTEPQDLLFEFDAVRRLADAQLLSLQGPNADQKTRATSAYTQDLLKREKYITPGPLWWAFNWENAFTQAELSGAALPAQRPEAKPENGCVILIDEIDKAETHLPNGLLETLGQGQFFPPGVTEPVQIGSIAPLIIITSNGERILPRPFLRRCLVLDLELPADPNELEILLVNRGKIHFPIADSDILLEAARLLVEDRQIAQEQHHHVLPGQAEYLDLLRAVLEIESKPTAQKKLLTKVACFTLKKQGHR